MNRKAYIRLAGYILFFVCLTFVFSIVNYPSENLTSIVNGFLSEASDNTLSVGNVNFKLPFSLKLGDVVLVMGKDRQLLGDAVISPRFWPLLMGQKAITGHLEGPWDSLQFKVRSRDDGWDLNIDPLKVNLEDLPLPVDPKVSFRGGAGAILELKITGDEDIRLEGQGHITGTKVEVFGGLLEPLDLSPLKFSSLNVFFTIEDNVMTINENSLKGDISASVRGSVRLVPSRPGNSRPDLTLDIQPGPGVRERLSPVLSLLGVHQKANGGVVLRVRGTIDRPRVTS